MALCLWFRLWTWGCHLWPVCRSCWGGGPYWPGGGSFRAVGGLVVVSGIEGLAGAPRLLGFILLLGCSGTLLVVSALDVVWDCHLRPVYRSYGVSGSFFAWDDPFRVVGGLVGYV